MTPKPTPSTGQDPASGPSPSAMPSAVSASPSLLHVVAIAAAVAGGSLATLLVMTSRPAARSESSMPTTAAPVAATRISPKASETPQTAWSSKHQARWVSNHRKSAAFELEANRPVAVWTKQVRPTLVVRCIDKRTDVFVYTDSAARIEEQDENHTVRVAFDDEAGTHERWPDSVEHDALFAPDGQAMASKLLAARQMRFTFSPHNAAPVTATFEVAGLAKHLGPIAKRCGR